MRFNVICYRTISMVKIRFFFKLNAFIFFIILISHAVSAQQVVKHIYRFNNALSASAPGCGPDLTQAKTTAGCSGTGNTAGSYKTDNTPLCGSRTVYNNNLNWGLKYPNNTNPAAVTGTYTIQLYFKPTVFGATWSKIIDFNTPGRPDVGVYIYSTNHEIQFYGTTTPQSNYVIPGSSLNTSTYYFLTVTRNGATNQVDVYLNTTKLASFADAAGLFKGVAGTPVCIYKDDDLSSSNCEYGRGNLAYLSLSNQYSLQADVTQAYGEICSGSGGSSGYSNFSISPTSICDSSQNVTITYTGGVQPPGTGYNFTWDWAGGSVISGTGMGPYTINWNSSGNKDIKLVVQNTVCPSSDSLIKTLPIKPPPFTTVNQTICAGQSYLGYSISGTYTDHYSLTNGCDSTRVLNLNVLSPQPVIVDKSICMGSSYEGYNTSGTYTDHFNVANGCDSVRILNLTVVPPQPVTIDKSICMGEVYEGYNTSGTYTDNFTTTGGCDSIRILNLTVNPTYSKDTAVFICAGASYELPDKQIETTTGTYKSTLSTILGCDSIINTTLTVATPINNSVNVQDVSCYDAGNGEIQISATGGTPPYSFKLDGATTNTSGTFTGLDAGSHSYVITDDIDCSFTGDFFINQPDKVIVYVHPVDTTLLPKQLVNLNASSNYPAATYQWNPSTFLSCDTCPDPSASPDKEITYHVLATVPINGNDCTGEATVIIHVKPLVIYFPNTFSPNGDGINDVFGAVGNKSLVTNFQIQLFDRWGEKVFEAYDVDFSWNGTLKNQKEPLGTYVYVVKYRLKDKNDDEPVIKGNVILLR